MFNVISFILTAYWFSHYSMVSNFYHSGSVSHDFVSWAGFVLVWALVRLVQVVVWGRSGLDFILGPVFTAVMFAIYFFS